MTFNEVNKILETINFNMNCCSILDKPFVKAGDGVVAVLDKGAYKVYYIERLTIKSQEVSKKKFPYRQWYFMQHK